MNYPISEIFLSIQWEWRNTWKPSIFVRFWWCNLQCSRCDSKYSRHKDFVSERIIMNLDEVIYRIKSLNCKHIIFTWWEPSLFERQIVDIQFELKDLWYTYEIETNWSMKLNNSYNQVNVSYKFTSSWNKEYELKALSKQYDYKFVVDTTDDIIEMEKIIDKYWLLNVYVMPLGRTWDSQHRIDIANYCIEKWYNYCQRTHIILFWDKKGV